jgi:hypothetical protein
MIQILSIWDKKEYPYGWTVRVNYQSDSGEIFNEVLFLGKESPSDEKIAEEAALRGTELESRIAAQANLEIL